MMREESLANLETSAKKKKELKAAYELEIKTILKRNNIYYTLHIYCTFVFQINHLHNNEKKNILKNDS